MTPADAGSTADVPPAGPDVTLVDHQKWAQLDEANDPLNHRSPESSCALDGTIPEPDGLEIRTFLCNYVALSQPSLASLSPGDQLHLLFWHLQLSAEAPAEAHAAILIGGRVVHERTIAIPNEAEIFDEVVPIDFEAPEGTPVVIHLHNHGANTWTFSKIERAGS